MKPPVIYRYTPYGKVRYTLHKQPGRFEYTFIDQPRKPVVVSCNIWEALKQVSDDR